MRDRLSKPKIKKIRKYLYRLENKRIKEIKKHLIKLEKSLPKPKKYEDYDDIECKGIRDKTNYLICQLMKIIHSANNSFNDNYFEYESKESNNFIN